MKREATPQKCLGSMKGNRRGEKGNLLFPKHLVISIHLFLAITSWCLFAVGVGRGGAIIHLAASPQDPQLSKEPLKVKTDLVISSKP